MYTRVFQLVRHHGLRICLHVEGKCVCLLCSSTYTGMHVSPTEIHKHTLLGPGTNLAQLLFPCFYRPE